MIGKLLMLKYKAGRSNKKERGTTSNHEGLASGAARLTGAYYEKTAAMVSLKILGEKEPWTAAHLQGLIWDWTGRKTTFFRYAMLSLMKQPP